jgi:hypothetical protein
VPESFGKRQRSDARAKKTAAREKRRAARNKRREERASGVLEAGTPIAPSDANEDSGDADSSRVSGEPDETT